MPGWILTPLARAQLQGILDYIEEDSGSKARALKVLDDFVEALDPLTDSPRIGPEKLYRVQVGLASSALNSHSFFEAS